MSVTEPDLKAPACEIPLSSETDAIFHSTDAAPKRQNNSLNWFFQLCPTLKNWLANVSFCSPLSRRRLRRQEHFPLVTANKAACWGQERRLRWR